MRSPCTLTMLGVPSVSVAAFGTQVHGLPTALRGSLANGQRQADLVGGGQLAQVRRVQLTKVVRRDVREDVGHRRLVLPLSGGIMNRAHLQ